MKQGSDFLGVTDTYLRRHCVVIKKIMNDVNDVWKNEWDWIFSLAVESTSRDSISFNSNFIFNSKQQSNENLCLSLCSYLHSTRLDSITNHVKLTVFLLQATHINFSIWRTSWELVLFIYSLSFKSLKV